MDLVSFFAKNNMKNIYLNVSFHEGGFFSNFNKVVTFLALTTDNVVKITWNLQGQPYGAFAYNCGEVFGKLFLEYNTGEDIHETFELQTYTDTSYTGKKAFNKYKQNEWRAQFNKTLKYFKPTDLLKPYLDKIEHKYIFTSDKINLIGILKRNNRLSCEQPNNVLPELSNYFEKIDKLKDENTYLYLAVDNLYDINSFIERYKKCIYNPKSRRTNTCTDEEPHFTPGTVDDAVATYLEVFTLSKCKEFIHPVSNMATAVMYFNPNIKTTYI